MKINYLEDAQKGDFIAEVKNGLIPFFAYFEVTSRCNLRCMHCFHQGASHTSRELSTKDSITVLRQLARAGTLAISFSGGEPLMRPDFSTIARSAKDLGFAWELYTNGTLITEEIADTIAASMPLKVYVTLYGAKKESYGRITKKPGMFKNAVNGVRLLSERKVPTRIQTILLRESSVDDLFAVREIAAKYNVRYREPGFRILPARNGERLAPFAHAPSEKLLTDLCKRNPEHCRPEGLRDDEELLCGKSTYSIFIDAHGRIGICDRFLSSQTFKGKALVDVWKNDPIFKEVRGLKKKDIIRCRRCAYQKHCYICPGISFSLYGDFKAPPPKEYCLISKRLKRIHEKLTQ